MTTRNHKPPMRSHRKSLSGQKDHCETEPANDHLNHSMAVTDNYRFSQGEYGIFETQ